MQLLKYPASFRVVRAVVAAQRALEQGFTTIRDVETEGAGYGDVGIKKAINEGYIPGPRMFVATRAISSTGGYSLDDYAPEITVPKGAQIIDGPVEARKAAREQLDHGADWIKVYMTHRSWVDATGDVGFATHTDSRGAQGRRRRSTRLAQKGRVSRLQRTWGCSAPWMAAATPSSTDSSSPMRRSRRW